MERDGKLDKDYIAARQLLLLLDSEERWFTLTEVKKELGSSDKTIRKITERLNKQMPSDISILVSRGKGIYLQRDGRSKSINEVISSIFRQTIYYRLMNLLFTSGGKYSLEEIAELLFMSASSLKKLIVQLNNNDLKPYKLQITYSAPRVKGNELNIRYFYWKLYENAYKFTGWPFQNISFEYIQQLITSIESKQNIVYFINSKRRLTFLVAIILQRAAKGDFVPIEEGNYPWEEGSFHIPVKELAEKMEEKLLVELPKNEVYFMQSQFSLSQYHYYEGSEMTPIKEIELYRNKPEFHMGNELISLLTDYYVHIEEKEQFQLEIYKFFEKLLIDNAIPGWMAVTKSVLTMYVQKECQQIYQELDGCMKKWQVLHPSILFNDYHLTKLTLLVRSSLRYKSKKAFLIMGEEFSIRHYIANLIKKEIGDQLIIDTSIMKELTDEMVQLHHIDFVISNLPVSLEAVPVVTISTIPSKRDLENIRKELLR
ncbi:transcriptional antiterminator BglG [Rummeliibacillus stabekisii]|uniref:Transcriptional antiterminator BglG n=1 Tax=Rummeliibacillus stabekisii TaxID=241244 RepID=A0A143H8D3_9BACL|nr:transcriptional antiterminator BglG [Rummeliibacillus stabekisii]